MRTIADFRLLERLGKGADGDVWKVENQEKKLYALKFCPISKTNSNFHTEFQRLKRINIDGIINVHHCGEDHGFAYYSMDLIIGLNLKEYATSLVDDPERYHKLFRIFSKISLALAKLHQMGITHLDVKPENIIIQASGEATLLDFGRAVALGERKKQHGSLVYMSPEQRLGFSCGAGSDVYSLAVTMVEILTGQPAPHTKIGRPWRPLFAYSKQFSLELSGIIQQSLQIVASERPSMRRLHQACVHSVEKQHVPHHFFPSTEDFIGSCPDLTDGNYFMMGAFGSGRKRVILENIRRWYDQGHQSFIGRAHPTKPFHPWIQILDALLLPLSLKQRKKRIKDEADILKRIHPKLPILREEETTQPFSLERAARAIAKVLQRSAPIAVVLLDAEKMDIGSLKILKFLWRHTLTDVRIWGTTTKHIVWARCCTPPTWSPTMDRKLLTNFLPQHLSVPLQPEAKTPLQSQIKAWQVVAKALSEPHIDKQPPTKEILSLALLEEPFPKEIALQLTDHFHLFVEQKILIQYPNTEKFCFAFYPQKLMALQKKYPPSFHLKIQQAWRNSSVPSIGIERVIYHGYLAQSLQEHFLVEALRLSIERLDISEIYRYFCLLENLERIATSFWIDYARSFLALKGFKTTLNLDLLQRPNLSQKQEVLFSYLLLLFQLDKEHFSNAKQITETLINEYYTILPNICLSAVQEIALMYLNTGQTQASLDISQRILNQIQINSSTLIGYININITVSAALIYDLQLSRSLQLIESLKAHISQGGSLHHHVALLINSVTAHYQLGNRHQCLETLLETQELLKGKEHPFGQAYCCLWEARLAVETGDISAGKVKLREAIILAQNLGDNNLLAETWTLLLNVATHTANPALAKEAIDNYRLLTLEFRHDHWPASLAKWLWLSGDLSAALEITKEKRSSFGYYRTQVERLRLLIVLGQYQEARELHKALSLDPIIPTLQDIYQFVQMCGQALEDNAQALWSSHPWIELDLGQWHLLAISDRLQSRDIAHRLQVLHKKAKSSGHQLYIALGDPRFW